ncbi:MAG: hypothetical protein RLZZ342_227 [Candidatus Parcubacteria bacterium]|jgi:hypothetical protein
MKKTKKHTDFLSQFMGDTTRARIVRALILNEHMVFNAARMAERAGVSPRVATTGLAVLVRMGIARTSKVAAAMPEPKKRTKKRSTKRSFEDVWFLNPNFAHLRALSIFVRDVSPLQYEDVLDTLKKTGRLSVVVLSGSFVGDMSRPADIVVAGESISERRMETAMRALEGVFGRELRYATFPTAEFRYRLTVQDKLLRDTLDFPHKVLLDRIRSL